MGSHASHSLSQIYANLMASIRLTCEGRVSEKDGNEASEILGIVGLVFSCLFMVLQSWHAALFPLTRTGRIVVEHTSIRLEVRRFDPNICEYRLTDDS